MSGESLPTPSLLARAEVQRGCPCGTVGKGHLEVSTLAKPHGPEWKCPQHRVPDSSTLWFPLALAVPEHCVCQGGLPSTPSSARLSPPPPALPWEDADGDEILGPWPRPWNTRKSHFLQQYLGDFTFLSLLRLSKRSSCCKMLWTFLCKSPQPVKPLKLSDPGIPPNSAMN